MDHRNLYRPMAARDLVASAILVAGQQRGDGIETCHLEVLDVGYTDSGETFLTVKYRDTTTGERGELRLRQDSPIIVTGITI